MQIPTEKILMIPLYNTVAKCTRKKALLPATDVAFAIRLLKPVHVDVCILACGSAQSHSLTWFEQRSILTYLVGW